MKRLLVVGISATGKTQFSRKLSNTLKIPVFHLDTIFWKNNWIEEEPEEVENKIKNILDKDIWIIEGYIEPLSKERVERADKVLYLDFPGTTALWRGIKRWWKHKKVSRPELPDNNTDTFGFRFLLSLLKREERSDIENALKGFEHKVVRLKTPKDADQLLKEFKA